nr:retrovirus-related Pol polyprotein from transposon TNT 1-94 [Tanacetum cinerariifolium]
MIGICCFNRFFDELLNPPPSVDPPAPAVIALIDEVISPVPAESTGLPSLITVNENAPSPKDNHDIEVANMGNDPLLGMPIPKVASDQSSSTDSIHTYGSHAHSLIPLSITYPSNNFQSSVHHNVYNPSSSIPHVKYAPSVDQQSDFSQPDTGLIILVFQKGDDPIDAINHMMSFLTAVVTSRYPPTDNQLRNSSNPRQQATINNGRVTVQPIQGRQNSLAVVDTPMVEKSKLDEDKEGKAVDPSHYRGMIGNFLYLTASRPNLQFAICMYARYQARPTEKHLHAAKRIFQYLRGTVYLGLWYPKDSLTALTAFADADHVGCQDTRRSTSGSLQFLGDRLISWSSKRKKSAAISSTEVEYIALSKHNDIRYHFLKEHVENGVIEFYFVNTEYQLEDIFTKALGRERIEFLNNKLGMRSFTSETLRQLTNEVEE